MLTGMRWRIISLQAVLVLVLGFVSGFLFWANNFTTSQVRDELVAQKIYFPGPDQIKAGGALDPAEFPQEIRQYAGQQVDTGDKARVYANDFIGIHLDKVANGQTYSQVSTAAQADPTNAKLAAQKATLFQGETLRSILLNAYGWWTIGIYAGYAAFAMVAATVGLLAALIFELVLAIRAPRTAAVPAKVAKAAV
jgi:hypothetical protein